MGQSEQLTLEELIADAAWVRRVAAALVREPADADDLAQLTLVAAIERPPATGDRRRQWLTTVARNLARMMGRRSERRLRREARSETGAGAPSPEALVERAQLQRQLATLLTELEEPYRTTVLLCYFEDLSPSEIARRAGIPAGTVRWRLKQGLERLRARLDQLHVNRRAGWLVPMTTLGRATHARHLPLPIKGLVVMANKTAVAAGVGALVATTALVSVHEGRAMLARRSAPSELAASGAHAPSAPTRLAGDLATMAARLPPPPAGATREQLLVRDAAQRAEIVRLHAEIDRMLKPDPFNMPAAWKHGEDFIKPAKSELLEMAKDCKVRWDMPPITVPATTMDDDIALEAGVSDDERREFDRVSAEFTQNMVAQVRPLYLEVTGDQSGAETLTPEAMMNEIRLKVPEAVTQAAYWKLSHERAGLIPAATDTTSASAFERYLRLQQNAGDAFETALSAALGADRAHAIRTQQGSWGARYMLGGCPK